MHCAGAGAGVLRVDRAEQCGGDGAAGARARVPVARGPDVPLAARRGLRAAHRLRNGRAAPRRPLHAHPTRTMPVQMVERSVLVPRTRTVYCTVRSSSLLRALIEIVTGMHIP